MCWYVLTIFAFIAPLDFKEACSCEIYPSVLYAATVLCPALEAPARGSVVYSVDTGIFGYGVTATYSCHEVGEGLSGLDEGTYRICIPPSHTDYSHHNSEIIGVWSEYDPSCKSKYYNILLTLLNYFCALYRN